jgi:GAF domain
MSDDRSKRPAEQAAASGHDLQKVNERLKELVKSLRTEKERLGDVRLASAPAPAASPPSHEAPDAEVRRLAAELALAREAIGHANRERERLRERLGELEREHQRICDAYVAIQERTSTVAQLYVVLERLHCGGTRSDALTAIQEIVINVVGSEELAIFERRGDRLVLAQSFGVDPSAIREIPMGAGAIGRAAQSGVLYVAGRSGAPQSADANLTACIPLRAGERVVGAIAIWRLLGHKPGLDEGDQELFDVLSAHAGLALTLRGDGPRAVAV